MAIFHTQDEAVRDVGLVHERSELRDPGNRGSGMEVQPEGVPAEGGEEARVFAVAELLEVEAHLGARQGAGQALVVGIL